MSRRSRRTRKKQLKIGLMLILLAALAFGLPYLWSVLSSNPDAPTEPKAEELGKH